MVNSFTDFDQSYILSKILPPETSDMWWQDLGGATIPTFEIKFIQVKPEYSSFIGNFLFRTLNLPDPILASIEISRRGYEFYNQYIIKVKNIKKNIIQPKIDQFRNFFVKSLEEFNLEDNWLDFKSLYNFFKKSKMMYRLSIDQFNLQFSSLFSYKSQLSQVYIENNLI